jgi:hypothetical protein
VRRLYRAAISRAPKFLRSSAARHLSAAVLGLVDRCGTRSPNRRVQVKKRWTLGVGGNLAAGKFGRAGEQMPPPPARPALTEFLDAAIGCMDT